MTVQLALGILITHSLGNYIEASSSGQLADQ